MKITIPAQVAAGLLASLALPATSIAQPQLDEKSKLVRYVVTDLGALAGGNFSEAYVVSNSGLVGGTAALSQGIWHAALWYKGLGADIATPGLGGQNSQAFGVNQRFQAVGQAETLDSNGEDYCGFKQFGLPASSTACVAFLWQNGVMTALPALGGANSTANMINTQGEVVGNAETNRPDPDSACPVSEFKPVIWKHGNVHELPTFPGDPDGVAAWINDHGQVVGASGTCSSFNPNTGYYLTENHALLWDNGEVTDLGNLGGSGGIAGNHACALNNSGQVVGHSELTNNTTFHGFLWTRKTGMQDLGTLDGDYASLALGINDDGVVVGVSLDANFNARAVLWQNGTIADVNTLIDANPGLTLQEAVSINAGGEITGVAQTNAGETHAFLARPVERNHGRK